MTFIPKPTKEKKTCVYKSLYISQELVKQIDEIVEAYHTSFNNAVVSMIEQCLADEDEPQSPLKQ